MDKHKMNLDELNTVTNTTGMLLESTPEDFSKYLNRITLGDLHGVRNYLKAEYERVKQVKDSLVDMCTYQQQINKDTKKVEDTIDKLYTTLLVIETRHDTVCKFIVNRSNG